MRRHLPGFVPSGWARLVGRIVHCENGLSVVVYAGFGLTVAVRSAHTERGRFCWVDIHRRNGPLTYGDLERVMLGLYAHSPWKRAVREMYRRAVDGRMLNEGDSPFTFMSDIDPGHRAS